MRPAGQYRRDLGNAIGDNTDSPGW